MPFDLQPILQNELIIARPLKEEDFEALYLAASDPLVWDQHPNKNRYQREEFLNFFKGAMKSGGAFAVIDKASGEIIGSSRFYDPDEEQKNILIGYTFFKREYWGKNYNHSLKHLMVEHAFKYVDKVIFHIGATNFRSQKSIEKTGANKVDEMEVTYYGEAPTLNFVYEINRVNNR
jgi:RimJ/RimL family protein N-acetyltransferase